MGLAALKLLRAPNLLIVGLTQVLLYFQVLLPALQKEGIAPTLSIKNIILLVAVTMIIAAAGYVINDLKDIPIDRINKPDRMILERVISVKTAWWIFLVIGFRLVGSLLPMSPGISRYSGNS